MSAAIEGDTLIQFTTEKKVTQSRDTKNFTHTKSIDHRVCIQEYTSSTLKNIQVPSSSTPSMADFIDCQC